MQRTVLVTGSNRGIGLELVRQYAGDGWRVIATCRDPDDAAELQALAQAHPDTIQVEALDVADFDAVGALAARHADQPIDVLINNAGVFGPKNEAATELLERIEHQLLGALDFEGFEAALRVNTLAPLRIAETFLPQVEASTEKKLVFISSAAGSIAGGLAFPAPVMPIIYPATKAALNKAMTHVAKALAARGIIAASICPGHVRTRFGGPGAALEPAASVAGMRTVIAALTAADSGRFLSYDGSSLPW